MGILLDILRFPLYGSRLIEASAGTGKTFTIATLYVRLVLGQGGDAAFQRPLMPPQILVVTFTQAATQALRDRIRRRLVQAAEYFLADPYEVSQQAWGEDILHAIRHTYPPQEWLACARKLQVASAWMDEAAIFTIHGWCHRVLCEYAFASRSMLQQTLVPHDAPLVKQAVQDYWRYYLASLDLKSAQEIRAWWSGPDGLQAQIMPLLRMPFFFAAQSVPETQSLPGAQSVPGVQSLSGIQLMPEPQPAPGTHRVPEPQPMPTTVSPAELLYQARQTREASLATLKQPWQRWVPELRELFDQGVAQKRVNGRQIQARYYVSWLASLSAWCEDPLALNVSLSDTAWQRLGPGLATAWNGCPPAHPAFAALVSLRESLACLPTARADILQHAATWIRQRYKDAQNLRAQMSFDALLDQLDMALAGPGGASLATLLSAQFPVALVDEFQDTDSVQYRIFDSIYRVAHNKSDRALILIGDPKQAIYSFRGADIYTYLRARAAVQDRLYLLKKNFRATEAMVAAVNHCFERTEQQDSGRGAFLLRQQQGNPIPFIPAQTQGRSDCFVVENKTVPALTVWTLPASDKVVGISSYLEKMAEVCANEIAHLLTLSQQGKAGFMAQAINQGPLTPLRPTDIAILVNTAHQARTIREALTRCGVRSVYLSEGQSVFACTQASEIERWLRACLEPDKGRYLRAALATPTLGLSWQDLERLNHDELAWDTRIQQFRAYGKCWREQGVLPMLRRILDDFRVPSRYLATVTEEAWARAVPMNGARMMTDILHIAELLQQASVDIEGEYALICYLAERRCAAEQGEESDNEALTLRLEDDGDLIRVITVHKAKGLEYSLVFLPFAMAFRPVSRDTLPLVWHNTAGERCVSWVPSAAGYVCAERERLGEDVRKLYVALTRARYATWVGCAPIANVAASALGYLVMGNEEGEALSLSAALMAWQDSHPHIALKTISPDISGVTRVASVSLSSDTSQSIPSYTQGARVMQRAVRDDWGIASYSSLCSVQKNPRQGGGPETAVEARFWEIFARTSEDAGSLPSYLNRLLPGSLEGLHAFPKGAMAGTFLHELLNWAACQGFHVIASEREVVHDHVTRYCSSRGWSAWSDTLTDWLQYFVKQALVLPHSADKVDHAEHAVLSHLKVYLPEMEFWLGVAPINVIQLDHVICTHTLDGAPRPGLAPASVQGMLKGFIDLVFEHAGRYYVLDYKSNWLGPDNDAYTQAAMRSVIVAHRYELQYALYLYALHRLLQARLPDYDYDRHVGGALYVFLRGLTAPSRGLFGARPPAAMMHALDQLLGTVVDERGVDVQRDA